MDNGKKLGFAGDDNVKYADIVSGGVDITMVVLLAGGSAVTSQYPFMIFTNQKRIYSICGTPDNITDVYYMRGPKG